MHLNYYLIWAISYFDLMWGPLLDIWHQTCPFVLFFQYLVCLLRNIVVFYPNKQYPIYLFSENKNSMLEAEIRSLQRRLVRRDNDILKQERELHKLRVSKHPFHDDKLFFFKLNIFFRCQTRPYSEFVSKLHVHPLQTFTVSSLYSG